MGLDTTHGCWSGPYSSFNRFRYSLGQQIGINLDDYLGYGGGGTKDLEDIKHNIMPLLNHSDCEGRLTVKEARKIAKGLQEILDNFNEDIPADHYFKNKIETFRDGCLFAVSKKEMIHFG